MMDGRSRQGIAIIASRKSAIVRMGITREDVGCSYAKRLGWSASAGRQHPSP
jgi:hypothetical protein